MTTIRFGPARTTVDSSRARTAVAGEGDGPGEVATGVGAAGVAAADVAAGVAAGGEVGAGVASASVASPSIRSAMIAGPAPNQMR